MCCAVLRMCAGEDLACCPSPRRLVRQETSSGHHGGGSRTRALSWKACERGKVLLERRWRHDMRRNDRSRKHGAKRFYRRWMREVMSNIRSMGHVTVRPLVCFPTGVRRVKQTLLSDHHRDGPSPTARTRTNARDGTCRADSCSPTITLVSISCRAPQTMWRRFDIRVRLR
jgi:hypothetical protein